MINEHFQTVEQGHALVQGRIQVIAVACVAYPNLNGTDFGCDCSWAMKNDELQKSTYPFSWQVTVFQSVAKDVLLYLASC